MGDFWKYWLLLLVSGAAVVISVSERKNDLLHELTPLAPRPLILAGRTSLVKYKSALSQPSTDWRAPLTYSTSMMSQLRRSEAVPMLHQNYTIEDGPAAVGHDPVVGSCASSTALHAILDDIVCSETYLKALITATKKCNLFGYFDSDHIRGCGVDKNGTYCRRHEREFPDPDYLAWDVLQKCSLQTRSGNTCSSSCKASLNNFAGKFGCCIHVCRVSWFVEDNPHILILSSALWTYCGLTRPKPCGNVPKLPSSTIAGSCTYGCYAYARSALICERVGSQLIETYNKCGRKGSAIELGQLCGINYRGMACFELQFSDNTDYLLSIYTACFEYFSAGVCLEKCSSALKHFRNKYSCCVNVYNGTAFGDSSQLLGSIVTNSGLWSQCMVDSPGMCTLPSDAHDSNVTTYNVEDFCDRIMTGGVAANGSKELLVVHITLLLWTYYIIN